MMNAVSGIGESRDATSEVVHASSVVDRAPGARHKGAEGRSVLQQSWHDIHDQLVINDTPQFAESVIFLHYSPHIGEC